VISIGWVDFGVNIARWMGSIVSVDLVSIDRANFGTLNIGLSASGNSFFRLDLAKSIGAVA